MMFKNATFVSFIATAVLLASTANAAPAPALELIGRRYPVTEGQVATTGNGPARWPRLPRLSESAHETRDLEEDVEARDVDDELLERELAIEARDFDDELFQREIEEEITARYGIEFDNVEAREVDDELLERELEVEAREFDDELFQRELEEEIEAREIEELYERDLDLEELEARDFDDELEAREIEELYERDLDLEELEARDFDDELEARIVIRPGMGEMKLPATPTINGHRLHILREFNGEDDLEARFVANDCLPGHSCIKMKTEGAGNIAW